MASRTPEELGIVLRGVTLPVGFYIPFWREFLFGLGFVDSGAKTLKRVLKQGESLMIVVGGAEEALLSRPGRELQTLLYCSNSWYLTNFNRNI